MTNCWLFCTAIVLVIGTTTANPTQPENATEKPLPEPFRAENKSKDKLNSTNATVEMGDIEDEGWEFENTTSVDTRRILYSKKVQPGKKPYMVYLQLTKESAKAHKYRGWLCGGVIVHANYVLTSAACIEDADRFYIVSGTTKFVDSFDYKSDDCVCRNRRKVVWKCIPKNYKFDFQDSIKWSSNDIAIVKVDKPFKFGVNEKGCEFATDSICYNNISREMEKPGTKGFIVGWGSGSNFREGVYRRQKEVHIPKNAKNLQEAKVCIMDNEQCAKKWAQRFRSIITQYMICTKDVMRKLSEICDVCIKYTANLYEHIAQKNKKRYANCTDVESRRFEESQGGSGTDVSTKTFNIDVGRHLRDPDDYTARRSSTLGGFCENDHGGPLIVKYQGKERVIGVISACKIDPKSHSCHGPFLYTSVFKNRQFISCAIHKDVEEENCRRVFRSGITHEEWSVNWDSFKEDDDDIKVDADKDDKSSDDSDETDVLREASDKKTKIVKKKKREEVSSSSSEEEERVAVTKAKEGKKVEKKKDEVKQRHKSKPKKSKKHGKSKAEKREVTESKKNKGSGEPNIKGQNKGDVFYESSKDENVNEPNED